MATIHLTNSHDIWAAPTTEGWEVYAEAGDDIITGGISGNDTYHGGSGDDLINGGYGSCLMYGDAGNDSLGCNFGNDTLYGGSGDDWLFGLGGNNLLYGDVGNDTLDMNNATSGHNTFVGGKGNDHLFGGASNDTYEFSAGDGKDYIEDAEGSNTLIFKGIARASVKLQNLNSDLVVWYNSGRDKVTLDGYFSSRRATTISAIRFSDQTLSGNVLKTWLASASTQQPKFGEDTPTPSSGKNLQGTSTADRLTGGSGNDTLRGYAGNDTLSGGEGRDLLYGDVGNDSLAGNAGNDTLYGGEGADILEGGNNDDLLYGGVGNDRLLGNLGADKLDGGDGNDTLGGGYGNDTLTGGNGKDTFIVNKGDAYDVITDVTSEDVLKLGPGIAASDLKAAMSGNNLVLTIGSGQSVTLQNWSMPKLAEVLLNNGNRVNLGNLLSPGGTAGRNLQGTAGADRLTGGEGNDTLRGYAGNDTLSGGEGKDLLYGDNSNGELHIKLLDCIGSEIYNQPLQHNPWDTFSFQYTPDEGTARIVTLNLATYKSQISGASATYNSLLEAFQMALNRAGYSSIITAELGDRFDAYATVTRYGESYTYFGTGRQIVLKTTAGVIAVTDDNDHAIPSTGWSTLDGSIPAFGGIIWDCRETHEASGNDVLEGGAGNDTLYGQAGNDTLSGGDGADLLYGGAGNDSLMGNYGADKLYGGNDNDTLKGGYGNDTLTGGNGKDTFIVNKGDGYDVITDATIEDTLRLGTGIVASDLKAAMKGNNLVITIGSNQTVTLQNWNATQNRLTTVTLNNGDKVNVNTLFHSSAFSSLSPNKVAGNTAAFVVNVSETAEQDMSTVFFNTDYTQDTQNDDSVITQETALVIATDCYA